ncbi:unnamed protein product, partial [Ectocarpus sp. 12 AP-2014]
MYLSKTDRIQSCRVKALTSSRRSPPPGTKVQRRPANISPRTANMNPRRTARIGEGNVKHRGGTADCNVGKADASKAGQEHGGGGGGGGSSDKKVALSGDETEIPSPLSSRASSALEMDQGTSSSSGDESG